MEERTSRKRSHRRRQKRFWVVPAVIAVVLLGIGFMIWGRHGPFTPFDTNAVDSSRKPLTQSEMLNEIQKAADESAFRFKMNTEISVEQDPDSATQQKGDWNIINSVENSCNMEVTITGEDGTVLYESRTLRPGEQDLIGDLKETLEPGSYPAEATAKAIDPENGEVLGNVTTEITLNVQSNS